MHGNYILNYLIIIYCLRITLHKETAEIFLEVNQTFILVD